MGRMVEYYDAFVLHNAEGSDLEFVQEMIRILEGPKYNFRLFLPWRDLHSTDENETEVLAEILTKRCGCAVVVISSNLLRTNINKFLLSLIHAKHPSGRNSRLIPILVENCELPTILQSVTVCDFTKRDMRCWVWPRMASSLKNAQVNVPARRSVGSIPDILQGTK